MSTENGKRLIGLDLARCIADLAARKVDATQVVRIVSHEKVEDFAALCNLVIRYTRTHQGWGKGYVCEQHVTELNQESRLHFPVTHNQPAPDASQGHWIDAETNEPVSIN